MPLYKIEMFDEVHLVYGKTKRGAQNHILNRIRDGMRTSTISPLEAAILAGQGIKVETVGKGPDVIMDNPPPEARRGAKLPFSTAGVVQPGVGIAGLVMGAMETILKPGPVTEEDLNRIEQEADGLRKMTRLDEDIEADHPGWMTGDPIPTGEENPTLKGEEE